MKQLKAPFPYFGGKRTVASLVWPRLGDVRNYIEPFCGSAAMLLCRPHAPQIETINDIDCMVANFWRATQHNPEMVASWADWPVSEADLHARHRWLVGLGRSRKASRRVMAFRRRMREDPDFCDAKIAGWWCWGACMWIGGAWCAQRASGPKQQLPRVDGDKCGVGVHRKRPALADGNGGSGAKGVLSKRPKLSSQGIGTGVHRLSQQMPELSGDAGAAGRGVHTSGMRAVSSTGVRRAWQQRPDLSGDRGVVKGGRPQLADAYSRGRGIHSNDDAATCDDRSRWLIRWFQDLRDRLRPVRVCCGDWQRVCGSRSVTTRIGVTGVFLDPPYSDEAGRSTKLYAEDCLQVAHEGRSWCLEHGDDPKMRIALCGYAGEHEDLEAGGWDCVAWEAQGGYGNRGAENVNKRRERIWFSPHCQQEASLFQESPCKLAT